MFRASSIVTFLSLCLFGMVQGACAGVVVKEADFETIATAGSSRPVDSPPSAPEAVRRTGGHGESFSGNGSMSAQNLVAAALQCDSAPAEPPAVGRVFRPVAFLARSADGESVYRPPKRANPLV